MTVGGFTLRHAVGLAAPASDVGGALDGTVPLGDLDLYYRIQAAVPF